MSGDWGVFVARPRKEIDQAEFEKLCALQCTKAEIAGFFNLSEDTVERWCKRTYKESFAVVLLIRDATAKSPYAGHNSGWQKRIPEWLDGLGSSTLNRKSQ